MKGEVDGVISVGELARRLRQAVEQAVGGVWVEGEVSSCNRSPTGHLYFTLRDEGEEASVDCVIYRSSLGRGGAHVTKGARIQAFGKATVYAAKGRLQLVVDQVRPQGRGALLEALEQLKAKLLAEGLFKPERKRPLPAEPRIVGVVTSPKGAVFHDVRTVAFRRGNVRIVLSPAVVQGADAPRSLIAALDLLERLPGLDVVIIGRGGGAGEDLQAFNDEALVRRIARLKVPCVSAVGHETDHTLTDLVADLRAATPSQAAELVVPSRADRMNRLQQLERALARALRGVTLGRAHGLQRLRARLTDPRHLIADRQQQLDELRRDLERAGRRLSTRPRPLLDQLQRRLQARHPRTVLGRARLALGPLEARLRSAMDGRFAIARERLVERATRLEGLSPLAVLSRGYAIVLDRECRAVRSSKDTRVGDEVSIRLHRGTVGALITKAQLGLFDEGKPGGGR